MVSAIVSTRSDALTESTRNAMRLGERLIQEGFLSEAQLKQALEVQRRSKGFLGQILIDLGYVRSDDVGNLLASVFHVPYIDLLSSPPDPKAVALVTEDQSRSTKAIPYRIVGDTVEVAMVDPLDVAAIDQLHLATGRRITPLLTMPGQFLRSTSEIFDASMRTNAALRELAVEERAASEGRISRADIVAATEAPIVRLVSSIIESALDLRASDIHFESQERGLRVRLRIDGKLLEHTEVPRPQIPVILARLKILCGMDITESRHPQDGRMSYDHHDRIFDLRASVVPAINGEKFVLRILDKAIVQVPLPKLGFLPDQQRQLEDLIARPHGMVIVVGPTGSGKSTTLYTSLNLINDSTRNIMTLEDPVEQNVPGITQVQVNSRIGLTFASGLRTFVRQDPDVILVGEIRDHETAEMAVQASLTGRLMLSTLHTNSAIGTFARLANLGVDRFLISQALAGVISQRLIARICSACSEDYLPSPQVLAAVGIAPEEAATIRFKRGRGCRVCHGRGYLGRVGIYEILVMSETIRHLILEQRPDRELQEAAERQGMRSLRESAMMVVRDGITTPEELGRVVLTKES